MGVSINNCGTGLDMSGTGNINGIANGVEVGSVVFIDSTITNTPIGFKTARAAGIYPGAGGTLALENVVLTNVPTAIQGPSGVLLAGTTGTTTIAAWLDGKSYSASSTTSTNNVGTIKPFP